MGSLVITLLQIFCWINQWKNFENRLRFDGVTAMSLVVYFFGTQCSFLTPKSLLKFKWVTSTEVQNAGRVDQNQRFLTNRCISKIVQDRDIATMESYQELACSLSNCAICNNPSYPNHPIFYCLCHLSYFDIQWSHRLQIWHTGWSMIIASSSLQIRK